jgi:hypothetical protein
MLSEKFAAIHPRVGMMEDRDTTFDESMGQNFLGRTPQNPLRMVGAVVRCDLDGFSAMVEGAFDMGPQAVSRVAQSFKDLMDYAEVVANMHQPCVMLPWAGDCATFLLPEKEGVGQRLPRWFVFSMDWLAAEVNGSSSPLEVNPTLRGARWGVGAARGESGVLVVASATVQSRSFMIAAGWPQATAKLAQESAKADQVAIDTEDHQMLAGAAKQIFKEKNADGFWTANRPTPLALQQKAAELGKVANRPMIVTTSKTKINPPPENRPYYM